MATIDKDLVFQMADKGEAIKDIAVATNSTYQYVWKLLRKRKEAETEAETETETEIETETETETEKKGTDFSLKSGIGITGKKIVEVEPVRCPKCDTGMERANFLDEEDETKIPGWYCSGCNSGFVGD